MSHPKDKDFQCYELDMTPLAKLMGVDPKHAIRDVEEIIFKIQDRVIFIKKPDGNFLRTHWLSSVEKIGDKIQLSFEPKLKPYLLQLKEQFTQFKLGVIVQFKSAYTIRIYALLKQYESIGVIKFEVENLRDILGIEKAIYPQFKEFKRRVLNQAKKEFEEKDGKTGEYKSDITFDLETKREARFIKYLIFHIKQPFIKNPPPSLEKVEPPPILKEEPQATTPEEIEVLQLLKENGVNETTASRLIKDFPLHRIVENVKFAREKHKNGRAKDLGALTVVAIRKDWARQATAKSPPEQVSSEKKRQLQAANEHREKEKKQLETLKSTFNEKRREKVETLIASWEGDRLSAEIEEYIESKSPEVKSLIRQWYEKYGFDSPFFKPAFRVYLSKKYLPKEEHDFVTWARARGSSVEGNKEGVRSLKSIGDVLKDVVPKIDDRH
jgi:NACalpha-BTF3-like transcription factor